MTLHSWDRMPTEAEAREFAAIAAKRARYRQRQRRAETVRALVGIAALVVGALVLVGVFYLGILGTIALADLFTGR